jgi:hypothetical protein
MNNGAVYLFVFDTMADWEPAFAIAGINNPQFQLEPSRYQVTTVGTSKGGRHYNRRSARSAGHSARRSHPKRKRNVDIAWRTGLGERREYRGRRKGTRVCGNRRTGGGDMRSDSGTGARRATG